MVTVGRGEIMSKNKKQVMFFLWTVGLMGALLFYMVQHDRSAEAERQSEASINEEVSKEVFEVTGPKTIDVVLKTEYIDGTVEQEVISETIWSMEDFWAEYSDWQLVEQDKDKMVFYKKSRDLSPVLKANGYFGVTENDVLSIFEGKPEEENVIQTFFQIDVGKLESNLEKQIKIGIPIQSSDHYEEVMASFQKVKIK
ncbi:regulator [Pseudalkalibacillus caeni]|uniref:Regulator n=2 Tax=Exobacillus caeni TaxID=2574798 RepID=A0A5R9FF92_9BACL|nr:regulator [Pseudalkalibacillus caeni]